MMRLNLSKIQSTVDRFFFLGPRVDESFCVMRMKLIETGQDDNHSEIVNRECITVS